MAPSSSALAQRSRWWILFLALLTLTCGEPVTAPRGSAVALLRVAPAWPALIAPVSLVAARVNNVRVQLSREDGLPAADTVVVFPVESDTLRIVVRVLLRESTEQLSATLQLRAGTEVLFEGTQLVTASTTMSDTSVPEIPITYVGVGADAATVDVTPADSSIGSRDSIQFSATARTAQSTVVAAPIAWSVSPESFGSVDTSGLFRGSGAGAVTVTATTPTGVAGSTTLTLAPTLQGIEIVSGDAAVAEVTGAFAAPLVARAVDDSVPVPGAIVEWSVTSGLALLSASADTADVDGLVQIEVTADTLAGPIVVRATANGSFIDFTLRATGGPPATMEIVEGDGQSGDAGLALAVSPRVRLLDGYGNSAGGNDVSFVVTVGDGTLEPPASVQTDSVGVATGPVWTLGPVPGAQSLEASAACAVECVATFNAIALVPPTMTLVKVSGDLQTSAPGASLPAPLVVRVENSGTPVPNVPVAFRAISGGGVLSADTVLTDGVGEASVSYAPGSVGSEVVRASVSPLQADFTATGSPVGFNQIWLGATDNWQSASNWSGAAVPTSTDSTYIPRNTPNAPRLTAAAVTAALVVDDPRGLDVGTFTLQAFGTVRNAGAWSGTGLLELRGVGAKLSGMVGRTTVFASTALSGAVTIGGALQIQNSSTLVVGPYALTLGGALTTSGGGRLQMKDPAGIVTVSGNATFNSLNLADSVLTAGVLDLKGNLTATSANGTAFRAAGTHLTRFSGTAVQTVNFFYNDVTQSRLQHVEITNPAGVQLTSNIVAFGDVTLPGTGVLTQDAARTFSVGGLLTAAAGTAIDVSTVTVINGTGPAFPAIGGTFPTTLRLASGTGIPLIGPVSPTSNLVIESNTSLVVGPHALTLGGALTTSGGGRLQMKDPAGIVTVSGNATFNSLNLADSVLTAGVLDLKGNLTATSANGTAFRAAGTHLTRFSGTAVQTVNFFYNDVTQSRLQHVEITNPAGVQLTSNIVAFGDVTLPGTGVLTQDAARTFSVGGLLTSAAGTAIDVSTVTVINGTGPAFPAIGGTFPTTLRLASGTGIPLIGPVSPTSNLVIESNTSLVVGPHALTLGGALTTSGGGRLQMKDPAGIVTVSGNATFNSLNLADSVLTAGVLDLKGNLTATSANGTAFRAAGTHLTRFSGTAVQTVNFFYNDVTQSRLQHVEITNTSAAGVSLTSNIYIAGAASQAGRLTVEASRTLTVAGTLTLRAGSSTTVLGAATFGSCVNEGAATVTGISCP